jgi:hypothetical protein
MKDIVSIPPSSNDLGILDNDAPRAKNILSTQINTLFYAPDLGIDLKYFLSEDFRFQTDSFKAYLIERLSNYSINVASVDDEAFDLFREFKFNLTPSETDGSLVSG